MVKSSWPPSTAAIALIVATVGCGSRISTHPPELSPVPTAKAIVSEAPSPSESDPVESLIATSQRHFTNGQRELERGHLDRAREEFDKAIDVLLTSPYGARTDPRIGEQFDRLVDRISTYEISALVEGDGFAEKPSEPASIDGLLAESTFAAAPTPEVKEVVRTDPEVSAHDIPIPQNDRVLSYIALFQGKLHDWIEDGLQRGSRYLPMIQDVFRAEGLPLDLAYVPLIESAFKPNALSRAKAKGVWQFMKGTALENGLRHDWYIDERSDPEKATAAAARYLRTLNKVFNGDWHLALASYNGGPGRVQRAMRRTGLDDFWAIARKPKYLPRETREYVPMILAAMVIARNPAQYGFNLIPEEPLAFEKVTVPKPIDLRRVAEWSGTSIDEIQTLNPELRRWTTPVRDPEYQIKVPMGTATTVQQRLNELSPAELTNLQWHTVRRGESLASIARRLRVSRADLADANYLSTRSRVRVGQRLIIPRAPAVLLTARLDDSKPAAQTEPLASADLGSQPSLVHGKTSKLVYRVRRGDTLSSIARLFDTSVASLKVWNRLRGSLINPGDRLTIFATRRPQS